ncbi:PKD domain-containing protein [Vicingaceae bacterium]|nr:PKD domain-containing protein [Vicingaceae bacterium]
MKNFCKSLIVTLCVFFSFNVSATHYMGGEITWECNNQGRYIFTVKIYRDCNGVPLTGNLSLIAHNYPTVGQSNTSFQLTRQSINDISATCGGSPCSPTNTRITTNVAGAVEEHVFTTAPQLLNGVPGVNGWIFTFTGPTRNNAVDNLTNPGGTNLLLRAKMFSFNGQNASTCYDNSPNFAEVPSSILCTGDAFTYNHNAQDEELDSLVYSWAEPLAGVSGGLYIEASNVRASFVNGYTFTSPFPSTFQNPNNVPASLNTENGEISYTSFTDGEFVSCVRVEAYRCGQKIAEVYRDIQTVLLSSAICTPNDPPFIRAPFESSPGVFNVYRDTVKAGDLVTFNLQVADFPSATNPSADSVRVFASGSQFGANFSNPNAGCLNPPCATLSTSLPGTGFLAYQSVFNWQTSCNHISFNDGCVSLNNTYNFVIRATDNACPAPGQTVTTISITVLADDVIESPDIYCLDVQPNGNVDLTWNQPIDTTSSFNAWMVYSGTNQAGPFTLIDSIFNYNTLSYTHVGAGADVAPRFYYVRSRSGCNDAVLNVAKDTLSTIFVNATLDATNACADVNWNPFNSLGSSGNYRVFRNGVQITTTNSTTTNVCDALTNCSGNITYRVERDNSLNACSSSSNTFQLNYNGPVPVVDYSFVSGCIVDPVNFTDLSTVAAGTITDWSWDFGDASGTSILQNPTYTYSASGTYAVQLTVTTNLNCVATISKNITLNPGPPADAGVNQSICVGQSATIGGAPTTSAGNTVSWSPSAGLSSITAFNPIANPAVTTVYTVTVTDGTACSSTDQVTVTVSPIPLADAGSNQIICLGESVAIGGAPTGPPTSTFLWSPTTQLSSPTAANPIANPSITTTYTVTVTTGPNCTATDQITVTVNPTPNANAGNDQTICNGGSVVIGGAPTGPPAANFSWSPAAGLSSTTAANPTASPTVTTTYSVTVLDANGCTSVDQVEVTLNPSPIVDAGPDQSICPGGSIAIGGSPTAAAGATFSWSPATSLSSSTAANPIATPAVNTIYSVTVTDVNGCTSTDDVTVTINAIPTADAGLDQTICNGSSVTIGGAPTGPTGATYLWSPATGLSNASIANPIANPTITTQYTVLVTSGVGCTSTDIVDVIVNQNPIADAGADQTICDGFSATIGGSPTGPTGVTFSWSPIASLSSATIGNPIATPTATTTYTVTITDGNGCASTDQVEVTVNPSPILDAGTDIALCIGGSTAIGGSPTGPTGSTYSWSPSVSLNDPTLANPIASPATTTTYTVVVTDANGCTNTDDIIVSINLLPIADAGLDTAICLGSSTPIGGSPTGPAGSTYLWTPNIGLSNSVLSNPIASPTVTTTYSVLVTDANGCTASDDVVVNVNPLPFVDAGIDGVVCLNDTLQVGGAPTGPSGSVYLWSPAATIVDPTVANPLVFPTVNTTYTVIVTDINGCVNTDDVLVSVNPLPIIDAGDSAYVCPGFSEQLLATGGVSYVWDADPTLSNLNISNPVANPLISTTYYVEGTDANGCRNRDSIFILVAPDVPTDAGLDQTICTNDSVLLGGSSSSPINTIYSWSPTNGLSDPTIANPIASPSSTTKYFLFTTNDTCTGVDSVIVTVNPVIVADFSASTICQNDSTTFTDLSSVASGSITNWSWDFGDGSPLSALQSPKHLYLTSGTFNVKLIITSDFGCLDSITKQVIVNSNPSSDAGSDLTICIGDTISIGGSPTGDPLNVFSWSPAIGLSDPAIANPRAFPQTTTKYFITVTDSNGCTGLDSMTVTVNPLPLVDAGADITICNQASAQLQASGAVTYLWSPGATLSDPTIANPIATPTDTIQYFVIGIDANGCQNIDSMTVFVSPRPSALFVADTVCEGNLTTFTDLSSISSGAVTSWSWDFGDGVGTSTLQNPTYTYGSDGDYTVQLIATSGLACSDTFSFSVKVDSLPLLDAGIDQAYCIGDTAQLQATGAVTYTWSPVIGLSDPTIANPQVFVTPTTTYTVTGTGANGCFTTDDITITVNPLPVIDAGNDLAICIGDTIVLGGSLSGPITATYLWTPSTGLNFDNVPNPIAAPQVTTKYFLEVVDSNSCISIDSIEVIVNPLPVIDAGVDTSVCKGATIQLNATGAVSYLWSPITGLSDPFIGNPIASIDTTTRYIVTGTDANGCVSTDTLLVEVLDVDFLADLELCEGESLRLNPMITGDTAGVTYLWTPTRSISASTIRNPIVDPLATTKYYLEVTNANGCKAVDSVIIKLNLTPIPEFIVDFTVECDGLTSQIKNYTINGIVHLWNVNGSSDTLISVEPNLDLEFNSTNEITLIAINNTCADTLTKLIEVGEVENYLELIQTNIFTPNGDGINDAFRVEFKGDLVNCAEILIFNRWGDVVFTSNVERSGWDGRTQSGDKAPPGTYFYVIKLSDAEIKGSVMLSR